MNPLFLPNGTEEKLIQVIQAVCRNEFVLIRLTPTMLKKSIIDASEGLRNIMFRKNIVDFHLVEKQDKIIKTSLLLVNNKIIDVTTSFYRPETKNGDPRFWLYGLKRLATQGTLIYFTYVDTTLVAIPLVENGFEATLSKLFQVDIHIQLIEELRLLISGIKAKGFVKSVSPTKSNPKDVGNTLEILLGIPLNSLKKADYKDKIEIKTKRKGSGTKDSLFSCVPDWDISATKSSVDMILKYGYLSREHPGFFDLYVTVGNAPNNQGLFLEPQNSIEQLFQYYQLGEKKEIACKWKYQTLKSRLDEKHPTTVWIVAEEKIINGEIHFRYVSLELTQHPIFSQFTSLIGLGIITFDWRGKVKPDRTAPRDHGHGFRIAPKHRNLLFGTTNKIEI